MMIPIALAGLILGCSASPAVRVETVTETHTVTVLHGATNVPNFASQDFPTSAVHNPNPGVNPNQLPEPDAPPMAMMMRRDHHVHRSPAKKQTGNGGPSHSVYEIVYSPYNDNKSCKDANTVRNDLHLIKSKNIKSIRVYSTDCGSLDHVVPVARELGMTVSQGLWFGSKGVTAMDPQVDDLLAFTSKHGWDGFSSLVIGNEGVLAGFVRADDLLDKARGIKNRVRQAGFNGNVMTAEPPGVYIDNPQLCNTDVFDQVGINAHPYFNPGSSAQTSGSFIQGQISVTKQHCPNKQVYITETGYPSKGQANGANVPSKDNQRTAIYQIIDVLEGNGTFLSTFDDFWKEPGPQGIEQYFGIIDLL
uniref:ARAD1D24156p n=1 Tax=Blastobotrys adeninivorans TaxID=409370 RepID=A0A060TAI0_BLAAD